MPGAERNGAARRMRGRARPKRAVARHGATRSKRRAKRPAAAATAKTARKARQVAAQEPLKLPK